MTVELASDEPLMVANRVAKAMPRIDSRPGMLPSQSPSTRSMVLPMPEWKITMPMSVNFTMASSVKVDSAVCMLSTTSSMPGPPPQRVSAPPAVTNMKTKAMGSPVTSSTTMTEKKISSRRGHSMALRVPGGAGTPRAHSRASGAVRAFCQRR